jgi:hypothetical protein
MEQGILLRAAAQRFSTTIRSARRILRLDTAEGRREAVIGYDSAGRILVRSAFVERRAREREQKGNWRVKNLKHHAEPKAARGGRRIEARRA